MNPYAEALAWALVHFVWQGAALALAAFVITRAFRLDASGRYAVGIATLAAMLASPIVTLVVMPKSSVATASISTVSPPAPVEPQTQPAPAPSPTSVPAGEPVPASFRATTLLLAAWLIGVMVFSLRLIGGWVVARRMVTRAVRPVAPDIALLARRIAGRLALDRLVRIVESQTVSVPVMVGWLKPVILLPVVAVSGLTPTQLEALIAHELAHVRRHDYLVNLLQAAVETLLFYHPAVWLMSKQVRVEREHCCDDLVVGVCDRLDYVSALTDLAAMSVPKTALAATGGSLLTRVQRILGTGDGTASPGGAWIPALVAMLVLGAVAPAITSSGVDDPLGPGSQAPVNVAVIEEAQPQQPPATEPQASAGGTVQGPFVGGVPGGAPESVPGEFASAVAGPARLQEQSTAADERARAEAVRALVEQASEERRQLDEQRLALERRKIETEVRQRLEALKVELDGLVKERDRAKRQFDVGLLTADAVAKIEQRIHELELQMVQAQHQMAQRLEELALAQKYEAVQRTYDERLALAERMRARAEIGVWDARDARAQIAQLERQLAELKAMLERGEVSPALERTREERVRDQAEPVANPNEPIRSGDVLAVEIAGETELPRTYVVQPDGTIRLPLLGSIRVAGMTARQAEQTITKQIVPRFIRSATVHVSLRRPRGDS